LAALAKASAVMVLDGLMTPTMPALQCVKAGWAQ
jgi:hypothetical protein